MERPMLKIASEVVLYCFSSFLLIMGIMTEMTSSPDITPDYFMGLVCIIGSALLAFRGDSIWTQAFIALNSIIGGGLSLALFAESLLMKGTFAALLLWGMMLLWKIRKDGVVRLKGNAPK